MNDVKSNADELALTNLPISDDDLALYILNGLSSDFKSISTTFHSQNTLIIFEELYEKLVEHSSYMKQHEHKTSDSSIKAHAAKFFFIPPL